MRPRSEANHACELGSHISTTAARLMMKLGQLPPPRPSAALTLRMASSREMPATIVRAKRAH
jgi:hypothetical protein